MKKFLLPIAAVLVGATAFAEEVTVKYYGNTFRDSVLGWFLYIEKVFVCNQQYRAIQGSDI